MVDPLAYINFTKYWKDYLPHRRHRILCYMLYKLKDQYVSEVTFSELIEELSLPENNTSRILSKLTSNGYLSRTKYKNYSVWTLTDAGIEYATNIFKNRYDYNITDAEWVATMIMCGVCYE